jgi:hypothetical protein
MLIVRWLVILFVVSCTGKVANPAPGSHTPASSSAAGTGGNQLPPSTQGVPTVPNVPTKPSAGMGGMPSAGMGGMPSDARDAGTRDAGKERMDAGTSSQTGSLKLPPAGAALDYQLGGAYEPKSDVKIVSRDRTAKPQPGIYNICYVNGFQAQPDEEDFWLSGHAELVLRDASGEPVIDEDWDELMLDISSADKRQKLAEIIGGFIDGCAKSGFDAVEIDNLDSFSRSGGRLSEQHAVDFMALLSKRAHASGLPIAQKNSAELVSQRAKLGTDFAIAEECNRYDECDVYTKAYGDMVFVIEYRKADFNKGCKNFPNLSMVLRDVNLTTPSGSSYVFEGC